ncbi:MAG: hypothetical protein GAK45_02230 [Pseudomonas citronellolis]|nr:MAG: hypothetical protein GAK45_02230 [Pseudomonas citronellolis]
MKAPLFALCLTALCSPLAQADSLRCGSSLVSTGDTMAEVHQRCGEPVDRASLGQRIIVGDRGERREVPVVEWTYGPWYGMLYFLQFKGGRLDSIGSQRGD